MNLNDIDLSVLNTLTKYPSIPTYHELGEKGRLLDTAVAFKAEVLLTEKVDGTNVRIILTASDYIIGSREELLYAKGDRIENPALGIVAGVKPIADRLVGRVKTDHFIVLYGELYGGNIGSQAKEYSSAGQTDFRAFDAVDFGAMTESDFQQLISQPREKISLWRENGGQTFYNEAWLLDLVSLHDIALTPRLKTMQADDLPASLRDMQTLLQEVSPKTLCTLDANAKGGSEGVVIRSRDRRTIAKARFQDYQRTLR